MRKVKAELSYVTIVSQELGKGIKNCKQNDTVQKLKHLSLSLEHIPEAVYHSKSAFPDKGIYTLNPIFPLPPSAAAATATATQPKTTMSSSSSSSSSTPSPTHTALLTASTPPPLTLFSTLLTASHILHHNSIVDAYGHISVRSPQNPSNTFFLSRSLAPALVSSREDIQEYRIEDASPVGDESVTGFAETMYPLGGPQVPVFDIAQHYTSSSPLHSLLVTNTHLGAALAAGFNPTPSVLSKGVMALKNYLTSSTPSPVPFPPCPTVLMRGHGMTCVGRSIEEVVYRAIFTCVNARVQTTALLMQGGYNLGKG
ncbi:hypothetical protein TI39_contig71g00009 [Zymoseptoria brevis]|uniref:Class II aldolase/adducin N-terminal domain-containing protein n=1 Tax=Zymoseptoria brevis TaxID=1047168 RepID=A0A0F4GXS1_9PEZI|nr:hypothetical protein TI39_contig71g00009 [Zymoseptoria brevis]